MFTLATDMNNAPPYMMIIVITVGSVDIYILDNQNYKEGFQSKQY